MSDTLIIKAHEKTLTHSLTHSLTLLLLLCGSGSVSAQYSCIGIAPGPSKQQPAVATAALPYPTGQPPTIECSSQYIIRVNVHYVLRDDGSGNFSEESDQGTDDINSDYGQTWPDVAVTADALSNGYAYAKGVVWGAIIQSYQNPQMLLPTGNSTPHPLKKISYVLGGVYFHRSSALYNYDPINIYTAPAGTLAPTQFDLLGENKGTEINVFMMGQNTNEMNINPNDQYSTGRYIGLSGGASGYGYQANNLWLKLGNVWRRHLWERSRNNGLDSNTGWWTGATLNHEVGHLLGLRHTFEPNGCSDTPGNLNNGYGNNVMDYGTNQIALTPCQIGQMQNELAAHYQNVATCGCGQVNSFFTLPSELVVIGNNDWAWLDARGSFVDNGTASSYEVVEVNQSNQPIGPVLTTSITGEPTRYQLHLLRSTRYRVTLTVSNGCNSSASTKYINTYSPIYRPGTQLPHQYAVFPNPATEQFTVRSDEPLPAPPLVRDAYGLPVRAEELAIRHEADGWYSTFALRPNQPGLYRIELGTGATRLTKQLFIK